MTTDKNKKKCSKCKKVLNKKAFYYNWKFRKVCRKCAGHK